MEIGILERLKHDSTEEISNRFKELRRNWIKGIESLREQGKILEDKADDFLVGNFAAYHLVTIDSRRQEQTTQKAASSKISFSNYREFLNHDETSWFYDNIVYLENDEKLHFDAIPVNTKREILKKGNLRNRDTEVKILHDVYKKILNKQFRQVDLYLYTVLEPCLSCDYAIIQFLKKFPEVTIHLYCDYAYNKSIYPQSIYPQRRVGQ